MEGNRDTEVSAFPHDQIKLSGQQHGMTLDDYFAAKVMQALIAKSPLSLHDLNSSSVQDIIAKVSYAMAFAMMEQKDRTEN